MPQPLLCARQLATALGQHRLEFATVSRRRLQLRRGRPGIIGQPGAQPRQFGALRAQAGDGCGVARGGALHHVEGRRGVAQAGAAQHDGDRIGGTGDIHPHEAPLQVGTSAAQPAERRAGPAPVLGHALTDGVTPVQCGVVRRGGRTGLRVGRGESLLQFGHRLALRLDGGGSRSGHRGQQREGHGRDERGERRMEAM